MENLSAFSSQGITYCCSVRCVQLLRDRPLVLLVPWCTGCSIIRNREVSDVFGRVKKFESVGWRSGSGLNLNWFLLYAHFVSLISDDWLDFFSLRPEAHRPRDQSAVMWQPQVARGKWVFPNRFASDYWKKHLWRWTQKKKKKPLAIYSPNGSEHFVNFYFEGFWFAFHFFRDSLRLGKLLRSVCRQVSIFCPHLLAVKVISGRFWPLCNWLYPRTANNLQLLFAKQSGNPLPVVVRGFLSCLWQVWLWPQFPYFVFYSLGFGAKITFLGLGNTVVWVKIWPSSAVALHI